MESSADGEAANLEIALLFGLSGTTLRVGATSPARIDPEAIVMLGQRDKGCREAIAVPSIAERVCPHPAESVHGQAAQFAAEATEHLDQTMPG